MDAHFPAVLSGLPILIVEDDASSAEFLAELLTFAGCQVCVASCAEDALSIVETFAPRIVVLDLLLPRMSGLVLARQLKAAAGSRDAAIVAVSCLNSLGTQRLALEHGCAAFVQKPVDPWTFPAFLARHVTTETRQWAD